MWKLHFKFIYLFEKQMKFNNEKYCSFVDVFFKTDRSHHNVILLFVMKFSVLLFILFTQCAVGKSWAIESKTLDNITQL